MSSLSDPSLFVTCIMRQTSLHFVILMSKASFAHLENN